MRVVQPLYLTIQYHRITDLLLYHTEPYVIYTFPYTTLFRSWVPASMEDTYEAGGYKLEDRGERWIEANARSEEHTSELQSHVNFVCRLLLEKKNMQVY